ncbi:MAG: hypothetical protein IT379_16365 [Deltaproteobacteria bacterium]|nr:hypothetical protein [Deltaproteobacteria bacterium]
MEASVVGGIAVAVLFQLGVALGLHVWARSVARRHPRNPWFARTSWLPFAGFVSFSVGLVLTVQMLIGAFASVASANPAEKAQLLARSISEAMNVSAFSWVATFVFYGASVAVSLVGTLLRQTGTEHPAER